MGKQGFSSWSLSGTFSNSVETSEPWRLEGAAWPGPFTVLLSTLPLVCPLGNPSVFLGNLIPLLLFPFQGMPGKALELLYKGLPPCSLGRLSWEEARRSKGSEKESEKFRERRGWRDTTHWLGPTKRQSRAQPLCPLPSVVGALMGRTSAWKARMGVGWGHSDTSSLGSSLSNLQLQQ